MVTCTRNRVIASKMACSLLAHSVAIALQQNPVAFTIATLKWTLGAAWQHRRISQLVEDIVHQFRGSACGGG